MNSTRDPITKHLLNRLAGAALVAGMALPATSAQAEQVSIQFSQTYPGGGTVTGILIGEDLNDDGRLYSVSPPLADALGLESGDSEVIYASVRIEDVLGRTVTNVFDASVADIDDPSNFFWGFAYNLDGGALGDEADEGVSFAPLAPSTTYVAGPLFAPAFTPSVIPDAISTCGNAQEIACSALITLDPVDPFPNFELLFSATSAAPVVTHELLRYTFEQDGFDGGASIRGTISGRDLDGDGKIYSASPPVSGALGVPMGDEVVFAQVEILGVDPEPIRNVQDLITDPIDSFAAFFFYASVNVAGGELGDEPSEALSISPFSPSTSVIIGEAASPIFFPSFDDEPITTCGDDTLGCSALVSLVPDADEPTGARLVGLQRSSEPVALTPAPLVVDADFSGHYFNKVPGGEGVVIQIIANGSVLVYWLSYDDDGSQRWLFGIGERAGLTITIDELYETDDGVFATTAPVIIDLDTVGSAEIEFTGCDDGVVRAMVDGVPRTMEIGRLTGLKSLECVQ